MPGQAAGARLIRGRCDATPADLLAARGYPVRLPGKPGQHDRGDEGDVRPLLLSPCSGRVEGRPLCHGDRRRDRTGAAPRPRSTGSSRAGACAAWPKPLIVNLGAQSRPRQILAEKALSSQQLDSCRTAPGAALCGTWRRASARPGHRDVAATMY
jgi:hypothetical protein